MTLLSDGRLVISGGFFAAARAAEVFDPRAGELGRAAADRREPRQPYRARAR